MILIQETIDKYGYNPDNLSIMSNKYIIVKCDYCDTISERKYCDIMRQCEEGKVRVSCGSNICRQKKRIESRKYILPEIGAKFHDWTTLEKPFSKGGHAGQSLVKCKCICGKEKIIKLSGLKSGATKSCGCTGHLKTAAACFKHGETNTRIYRIWANMKSRCNNPKDDGYQWYGAKGISVCEEWLKYETFRDWAFNNGYAKNLTIDRIEPNLGYNSSNCRWITQSENSKWIVVGREQKIARLEKENTNLKSEINKLKLEIGQLTKIY